VALQKIKFQTNIPVEAALKFAEGKLCDSQFGDPQYMFTTVDDRVFFVAEKVAQKIHGLRLKPEEPFEIIKAEKDYGNNRKGIEWQVNRVGFVPGEQPDGTFAVPTQPVAGVTAPATVTPGLTERLKQQVNTGNGTKAVNGNGNGHVAPEEPSSLVPWAAFLLQQTKQVIDVYALACQYANTQHGSIVRTDDVRAIMTTAFINLSKQGGANVT
jgi:hypothetical protein